MPWHVALAERPRPPQRLFPIPVKTFLTLMAGAICCRPVLRACLCAQPDPGCLALPFTPFALPHPHSWRPSVPCGPGRSSLATAMTFSSISGISRTPQSNHSTCVAMCCLPCLARSSLCHLPCVPCLACTLSAHPAQTHTHTAGAQARHG